MYIGGHVSTWEYVSTLINTSVHGHLSTAQNLSLGFDHQPRMEMNCERVEQLTFLCGQRDVCQVRSWLNMAVAKVNSALELHREREFVAGISHC